VGSAEERVQTILCGGTRGRAAAHHATGVKPWLGSAARAPTSFFRSRIFFQSVGNLESLYGELGLCMRQAVNPQWMS